MNTQELEERIRAGKTSYIQFSTGSEDWVGGILVYLRRRAVPTLEDVDLVKPGTELYDYVLEMSRRNMRKRFKTGVMY